MANNEKQEKQEAKKNEVIEKLAEEKIPEEIKEEMKKIKNKDNSNLEDVSVTSDIDSIEVIEGKVKKRDENKG